jgi:hypothetical protein
MGEKKRERNPEGGKKIPAAVVQLATILTPLLVPVIEWLLSNPLLH